MWLEKLKAAVGCLWRLDYSTEMALWLLARSSRWAIPHDLSLAVDFVEVEYSVI
jgi:hypothetical protein